MRLLYDTIITVKRRCGPERQKSWHLAHCMRGSTYVGARFCSCPGMLTVSDRRQDAAELSIGPCALVSRDILLIGTVHAAGKSQESRGVSHGSQPANNSDRLNIGTHISGSVADVIVHAGRGRAWQRAHLAGHPFLGAPKEA